VNYREAYGMYACNGILFNHESPVRGETFVTRKITRGLARIKTGCRSALYLGNLDSLRDWGHARDYVRAQWLMLQQDQPEDFRHRHRRAAQRARVRLSAAAVIVKIDPRYFRPTEVDSLLGDASKARTRLGWKAEISFDRLVQEMVESDLEIARSATPWWRAKASRPTATRSDRRWL
jgi:GDPmannose 4,6-dehydratase